MAAYRPLLSRQRLETYSTEASCCRRNPYGGIGQEGTSKIADHQLGGSRTIIQEMESPQGAYGYDVPSDLQLCLSDGCVLFDAYQ